MIVEDQIRKARVAYLAREKWKSRNLSLLTAVPATPCRFRTRNVFIHTRHGMIRKEVRVSVL